MTSAYAGVRVRPGAGARSCQASAAQAQRPARGSAAEAGADCEKTGVRQPLMKRLIGLLEASPKSAGRKRAAGAMPVRLGMAVSGCSTTTQSASAQRHRRNSATPQKVRPSRRFWCVCVLSLRVW
eukprot:6159779-Pleurochrysis_carterae.AAC.1